MAALRDPTDLIPNTVLFFPTELLFCTEEGSGTFHLNTATYLPNYMASHHSRPPSYSNISCLKATSANHSTYSDYTI